ncbi:MAG: RpiB/LacA/LacB family sugar-phosphate isomerase [Ferruginibacter sp.]
MKIGIAADHGGFELKQELHSYLLSLGHDMVDFGANELNSTDDYPDFVIPLAKAVAGKEVERGIAVCGSGVGAAVAANKIAGARACLINDHFSAHQGVEDDDLNIICLGGRVTGVMAARELIQSFLAARFTGEERHLRRLKKVQQLEK